MDNDDEDNDNIVQVADNSQPYRHQYVNHNSWIFDPFASPKDDQNYQDRQNEEQRANQDLAKKKALQSIQKSMRNQ